MKVTAKKNDGVSPVIGTILLVAITVVLVAIIAAVVMGMAGNVGTSHVVGVKVVQGADAGATEDGTLLVTLTGGDVAGLKSIAVYNGTDPLTVPAGVPSVGTPIEVTGTLDAGLKTISVVGTFADGPQTIYTGEIYLA